MLLLAILLLLAAVGLLVAALLTGQTVLAWGSVGLSAVVVLTLFALLRRARRRRREAAETDPDAALDDEHDTARDEAVQDDTARDDPDPDEAEQASPQPGGPSSETSADSPAGTEAAGVSESGEVTEPDETEPDETEPDEEDTDAADLLVVWELPDEVLVVDEHPRYHLVRCSWPDAATAERLPVQEARELGFTPCAQCRPDASLARKRRAMAKQEQDEAKQDEAKQDNEEDTDTGREPGSETEQGASSGGQDSDSSAVLG